MGQWKCSNVIVQILASCNLYYILSRSQLHMYIHTHMISIHRAHLFEQEASHHEIRSKHDNEQINSV